MDRTISVTIEEGTHRTCGLVAGIRNHLQLCQDAEDLATEFLAMPGEPVDVIYLLNKTAAVMRERLGIHAATRWRRVQTYTED